jgi:4-carboxymuconolactone decarboxylase
MSLRNRPYNIPRGLHLIGTCLGSLLLVPTVMAQESESEKESSTATTVAIVRKDQGVQDKKRRRAGEIIRQLMPQSVASMESTAPSTQFGGEFARLAYENAYVALWSRPGLELRDRSILTIGILIGIGNEQELAAHFAIALRNGLTPPQLEEMIYHATAYAGFPKASSALALAKKVVEQQQAK